VGLLYLVDDEKCFPGDDRLSSRRSQAL
jgi:hypothetical protein